MEGGKVGRFFHSRKGLAIVGQGRKGLTVLLHTQPILSNCSNAMNARIVKRIVCQCWLWLALALLSALAGREAVGQSNYQGIVYGHFPITPTPPPPAYVFPEDSLGWQLSGFVGAPSVSCDFFINGQWAYTFWAAGSGVAVNPSSVSNAVVAVPVDYLGASDAIPLAYGQLIGADAASFNWISDRWGGSGLTANFWTDPGVPSSYGYFTGLESAYLGLRFQQNGQTYYGWARLGVPYAGLNSCWLYDYAYSTIPDTPIVAGMGVPDPSTMSQFISAFSAANEVPARASAHSGMGQFTLNGNTLTYDLELDVTLFPPLQGFSARQAQCQTQGTWLLTWAATRLSLRPRHCSTSRLFLEMCPIQVVLL